MNCINVFKLKYTYIYISVYYLFIERPESHNLAARSFNVKALRSLTFGTLVIPKPCGSSLTFLKRLVTSLEGSTRSQYTKMESEKKKREIASKPKVAKRKCSKTCACFRCFPYCTRLLFLLMSFCFCCISLSVWILRLSPTPTIPISRPSASALVTPLYLRTFRILCFAVWKRSREKQKFTCQS